MVRQVFVQEKVTSQSGAVRERFGLAFGDHPDIPTAEQDAANGDDRVVQSAVARVGGEAARIRVVLDELVRGNDIEEILCDDESYSRVPVGTTPDDIAKCSGADLSRCDAVCIGPSGPIGIRDKNGDGAVDARSQSIVDSRVTLPGLRMIDYGDGELAVSIICDGMRMPLARDEVLGVGRSFYDPSGNQLIPYGTGVDGLGPALVLRPAPFGLRTGASCTVTFRPEVVDKDGNRVCAPADGDVSKPCPGDGNTDEIQFQVEPLGFKDAQPEGVCEELPSNSAFVVLQFVTTIDPKTLGAIKLSAGGADVEISAMPQAADLSKITVTPSGEFVPDSEYTITVGTGLTDQLGGALREPLTRKFCTGPAAPGAGPDAGEPDAGAPDAG